MTENTGEFFGKVVRWTRECKRKAEGSASRQIAREAMLLFANSDDHQIVSTFSANSPSEFDLRKLNPGAIFRHKISSRLHPKEHYNYHWYVAGQKKEIDEYPDIFRIQTDIFPPQDTKLKLGPNWNLRPTVPRKAVFPVREAKIALGFSGENFDLEEDWIPTEKIDLMSAGTREKVREKQYAPQQLRSLKPAVERLN